MLRVRKEKPTTKKYLEKFTPETYELGKKFKTIFKFKREEHLC